jgi:MFS-type transporter involved in bile tolerance (Atg22 family)
VGIAILAWTGVVPFVAPIAGQIALRRGERTTVVAGVTAMTVSLLALVVFVRPDSSYLVLAGPLLVAGVGTSLAFSWMCSPITVPGRGIEDHFHCRSGLRSLPDARGSHP